MSQIREVLKNIQEACERSGRRNEDVTLVAVSKGQPVNSLIEFATEMDQLGRPFVFGENYIQEYQQKLEQLPTGIPCHFIGHLQSNKVKDGIELFTSLHTLDSVHLASALEKELSRQSRTLQAFVQVNISHDPQKGGFKPNEVIDFVTEKLPQFPHLEFAGLMTITEHVDSAEEARPFYKELRNLLSEIHAEAEKCGMTIQGRSLSMGMSADYEVAIEEGATHVRIGTALFGKRIKK